MMNKNSMPAGLLLGALTPVAFFLVIYAIIYLLVEIIGTQAFLPLNSLIILCIAPNFLLVRHFFNKKDKEYTAQGTLIITVVYIILFFIFIHGRDLLRLPGLQ